MGDGAAAPVAASTPTQLSRSERYAIRSAERDQAQASGERAAKAARILASAKAGQPGPVEKQLSFELSSSSSTSPTNTFAVDVPRELVRHQKDADVDVLSEEGVGMVSPPFFCAASITSCRCPRQSGVDSLMCVNCGLRAHEMCTEVLPFAVPPDLDRLSLSITISSSDLDSGGLNRYSRLSDEERMKAVI